MNREYLTTIEKEMRKGLIEFAVLSVIAKNKIYTSDMLNLLKEAQLITSEGTLYPLLSRLSREEAVSYYWEESPSGPPRKYYQLTNKGQTMLNTYQILWIKISQSINFLIKKNEQ
ncbi:MAG: PadR family transcriptional regulator [bacterium]